MHFIRKKRIFMRSVNYLTGVKIAFYIDRQPFYGDKIKNHPYICIPKTKEYR